jgi:hypothetical protein
LPTDLEYGSLRTRAYDDQRNRANREDLLDQLEEATLRMTQQCQPGTTVTGQLAAGKGATVDTARNGPAVMAVAGERKQRSSRQPSSRPLLGQRENPLSRREDGAPVFRSSNGSRTRNGCPANHSSRRINSAAGQAAPLAGEAGDASPSP